MSVDSALKESNTNMDAHGGQLKRTLKLRHVIFIGLAYMAPLAVFDTFGIVSDITKGHVPAAYVLITIAVLFTAYSYGQMVKVYPTSGSAYTYTRKTMNSYLGFLVGWVALLDYIFLPMINALLSSIYLSAAFSNVPPWIWILATIVITTGLNLADIKLAVIVNYFMVIIEFLVAILFVFFTIRGIINAEDGKLFSATPFFSGEMSFSNIFAGASILALSFLGFDAVTTLSEETIEPKKTIPKAIFVIAFVAGIFFIAVTYFMQTLFPDISVIENIAGASPEIAKYIGGTLFQAIFIAGYLIAVLACGLTQQMSASRLLYAMGRDGVLPKKFFGYIHPRTGVPILNILLIGVLACSAMFLDLARAASLINFGAFIAFSFVNLSVIMFFLKHQKQKKFTVNSIISSIVLPLIGLGFNLYLWFELDLASKIVGFIWAAIGVIYLLHVTKFFRVQPSQFGEGK